MERELVEAWSTVKTEGVSVCPVCHGHDTSLKLNHLVDWQSHPPSGFWVMNICADCESGYLVIRPTTEYIHEAYKNYYTHTNKKDSTLNVFLRRVQKWLFLEYCSFAHQKYTLLNWLVYFSAKLIYPLSLYFDAKSRHIARYKNKGKLLDVGCGNGEFLQLAKQYGWEVTGVDFDVKAVAAARYAGLDIRHGGIDEIKPSEKFDFISLSHVIEHVFDPVELLKQCALLLTDDGVLWLETPNMKSYGFRVYKSNWRGLEPPRHIVLFSDKSLIDALHKAGFVCIEQKCHCLAGVYTALQSEKLLDKLTVQSSISQKGFRLIKAIFRIVYIELSQQLSKSKREYLTIIARKNK
ncbi:MAG: class I SAM-dependent methyltransferase [Methylococcales bacterium]